MLKTFLTKPARENCDCWLLYQKKIVFGSVSHKEKCNFSVFSPGKSCGGSIMMGRRLCVFCLLQCFYVYHKVFILREVENLDTWHLFQNKYKSYTRKKILKDFFWKK